MSEKYTWKIIATNPPQGTMVVEYKYKDSKRGINMPVPNLGENLVKWIDNFAPRSEWIVPEKMVVEVGMTGEGVVEQGDDSDT